MTKVSTRPQKSATPVTAAMTSVTAPTAPQRDKDEELYDLLDQAETICTLIFQNFGGDGSFKEPSTAPGIAALFACVTDLLEAADKFATDLDVQPAVANKIEQAHGLAEHLQGLAEEKVLLGSTLWEGFRIGDRMVAMGYWTIEKLIESAKDLPLREVQA